MKTYIVKKSVAILMTLAMVISLLPAMALFASAAAWDGHTTTDFAGGDGASADTAYQIATGEQLAWLAAKTNDGTLTTTLKFFKLTANIDLGNNAWTPIGTTSHPFMGTFDGNNKTVSNLSINTASDGEMVGLFGFTQSATIKNVGVESVTIVLSGGNCYAGGLVGYAHSGSTITNSSAAGSITVGSTSWVGGLAGYIYSAQVNGSNANVTCGGSSRYAGGLVGAAEASSTITNSYASGSVTGGNAATTSTFAGGLVGYTDSSQVTNSYSTGSVTGGNVPAADSTYTGGLVGASVNSSLITNSYAAGSVTNGSVTGGSVAAYAGGLVGAVDNEYTTISYGYWKTGTASAGIGVRGQDK